MQKIPGLENLFGKTFWAVRMQNHETRILLYLWQRIWHQWCKVDWQFYIQKLENMADEDWLSVRGVCNDEKRCGWAGEMLDDVAIWSRLAGHSWHCQARQLLRL